jgi:nitrate reductase gamma subunit
MNELNHTLQNMGGLQLLLALLFLGSYAMLLGGFVDGRAQAVAALVSVASAVAFVARTSPWAHGVLLVTFVVVGMGVFIAVAWMVTRLAGRATGVEPHSELMAGYPTQWLEEDEARWAEAQSRDAMPAPSPVLPALGPQPAAHNG